MDARGQLSFEFMVAVGAFALIFLMVFGVYSARYTTFASEKSIGRAQLSADRLGGAIDSVFIAGRGAQAVILLGEGTDLNISAGPNVVRAWTSPGSYASAWVMPQSIDLGQGIFSAGEYIVKNTGDGILVSPA